MKELFSLCTILDFEEAVQALFADEVFRLLILNIKAIAQLILLLDGQLQLVLQNVDELLYFLFLVTDWLDKQFVAADGVEINTAVETVKLFLRKQECWVTNLLAVSLIKSDQSRIVRKRRVLPRDRLVRRCVFFVAEIHQLPQLDDHMG